MVLELNIDYTSETRDKMGILTYGSLSQRDDILPYFFSETFLVIIFL